MEGDAMEGSTYAAVATGLLAIAGVIVSKGMERRSVTTAVLAEVQRLQGVLEMHLGYWTRWMEAGQTKDNPLIPFTYDVYKKQVANVGLISPKLVGAIVKFYGYLSFINGLQRQRSFYLEHNNSEAFDKLYQAALERFTRTFAKTFAESFASHGLTSDS
jgi:hypothetical protein